MRIHSFLGVRIAFGFLVLLPLLGLSGCGSHSDSVAETQAASDPQKAAAAAQAGAAASAANQQARQADEARRAAQKK